MPNGRKTRLRIISGDWRGQSFTATVSDKLRPTTDKNRETLFNWLMHDVHSSRCLDCFAGSGALGLEARSRGARETTFVDHNASACRAISAAIAQFKMSHAHVVRASLPTQLNRLCGQYDIIFIDPPYYQGLLVPTCQALCEYDLLADDCLIYLECESGLKLSELPSDWVCKKQKSMNDTTAMLYQKTKK